MYPGVLCCLLPVFCNMQGAINFAVQSGGAKSVKLVLFTESDLAAGRATHEITLDPVANKTGVLQLHRPGAVAT